MEFPVLSLGLGSRKSPPVGSSRLMQVEGLEERITPSGGKYVSPKLSFTVANVSESDAVIQGRVTGTYNAYSTVSFSGASSGSIMTDGLGYFTYSGSAAFLGDVAGVAWDNRGTQTSSVIGTLCSVPPSFISFSANQIQLNSDGTSVWLLSGNVLNEALAGNLITFSGLDCVCSVSTTTDQYGNFSVEVVVQEGESGEVFATATDCWGYSGVTSVDVNVQF